MCPPVGSPLKLKLMSMYLPKRLELSLRFVLAFPKASSTQLDLSSTFFTLDLPHHGDHRQKRHRGRRKAIRDVGIESDERRTERWFMVTSVFSWIIYLFVKTQLDLHLQRPRVNTRHDSPLDLRPLGRVCDGCYVLHDVFTGFCFSCPTFTWNNKTQRSHNTDDGSGQMYILPFLSFLFTCINNVNSYGCLNLTKISPLFYLFSVWQCKMNGDAHILYSRLGTIME